MEIWVIIEEAPKYEVSNCGRVRNRETGRILQPYIGSFGHKHVGLRVRGRSETHYIHNLVATYFCTGYQPGYQARHLDEDAGNNNSWNLKWMPARRKRQKSY